MEETKEWLNKIDNGGIKLWITASVALLSGFIGIYLLNTYLYQANPKINYLFIVLIIAAGYKLWMASAAAAVSLGFFFGLFKTLFNLFLSKKLNEGEIKGAVSEDLIENKTMEIAAALRKGSRKFLWTGLFFGLVFGAVNHIFMMKGTVLNGYLIFTSFGGVYGLIWYKLAYGGVVPVSAE